MADDGLLRAPPQLQTTRSTPDPTAPLTFDPGEPIFAAFLRQAAAHPDAVAVSSAAGAVSYGRLADDSARLARHLRSCGVTQGQTIVVLSKRCPEFISCLLGVSRSGAAFCVADAAWPAARVQAIVEQLRPTLLLVAGDTACDASFDVDVVRADAAFFNGAADEDDADDEAEVDPAADAYVMFTSGSTGRPRAVVTAHAPLVHFVKWHAHEHGFSADDRFSLLSGLAHDPVLRDVFTPLSIGASVVVPAPETVRDPTRLARWLAAEQVSVVHLTPALGEVVVAGRFAVASVRHFFFGGDAVNHKLLQQLRTAAPQAAMTNFYGATETPQAMAFSRLDPDGTGPIGVGKGIADVQLLVVDDDGAVCAPGALGEVWIRTPYLSRGYKGDKDQTNEKFIVNPFTKIDGDFVYKTGDLGRADVDGAVVLAGRRDHQLKIRGYRVEPAEVAAALEGLDGVVRAIVAARDVGENKALVAWFTASTALTAAQAKEQLQKTLPPYLVPSLLHRLDAFPLLANGKIDHAALPTHETKTPAKDAATTTEPMTEQQQALAAIWAEALGVPSVGLDESFLDLGGDSLSSLQVVVRMQQKGIADDVARGILQGRTIRELAAGTSASSSTLPPQAQSNLWVNVVRALLVGVVISEHWLVAFAPSFYQSIQPLFGPIFNLATPGFVLVFGLSLGYSQLPKFEKDRSKSSRGLVLAAAIVLVGAVVGGLAKLALYPLSGQAPTSTEAAMSFFSVLLYYGIALLTAPLWFRWLTRSKNLLLNGTLLIVAFLIASKITWALIGAQEVTGPLYVIKGLLTAKFNYFKMSSAAVVGLMAGVALRRRTNGPPQPLPLFFAGTMLMAGAVVLCIAGRGFGGLADADDMGLWRWLFCAGGVLVLGAAAKKAMTTAKASRATQALGTIGQLALPLFVLHLLVIDSHHILEALGMPTFLSFALVMVTFALVVRAMATRLYALYYGTTPAPAPAPTKTRPRATLSSTLARLSSSRRISP